MRKHRQKFNRDLQYYKFCLYGFLKNLEFFEVFQVLFFLSSQLTFLQIGILYSIREITRNLLEIPAGIFSDALGRRKTMIFSFSFYILSFLTFYFSQVYSGFVAGMIIYSLGDAFRTGTHKAMIFDYLKLKGWIDQKVYYYGHTRSWSQMGSAVSALIAAGLIFITGNYRSIYLYSAIPFFLDLLLIASYPKELDGEIAILSKDKLIGNFIKVFRDFFASVINRRTLKSIVNLSSHTGYYAAVKDYLQPVLQTLTLSVPVFLSFKEDQRSALIVGGVYFIVFFLTSWSSRNAGSFSERFKFLNLPLNLTLIVGLFFGLTSGWLYQQNMLILSVIFYIGIYLIENLRKPIGIAYVSENIDHHIMATVLSSESQIHALFAAILAPLIGFFADRFGLGYAIMAVSGIMILWSPVYMVKKSLNPGSTSTRT
jgi:MFS family permease